MTSADGRLTIIFNGSIYNHTQVRAELERRGTQFRSTGDTEVLLEAWAFWGENALKQLDGMFAFALLDRREESLWLARDRFGEKPLLLASGRADQRPWLAAGSDLRQFRHLKGVDWTLEPTVAGGFLNFADVDLDHRTFVRGVRHLPPGTVQRFCLSSSVDLARSLHELPRLWDGAALPRPDSGPRELKEASAALSAALMNSVAERLAADVSVGACLSGGLDSTAIVRTAATLRGKDAAPLVCVSAIFDARSSDGEDLSERRFVQAAARGAPLEVVPVSPDSKEVTDALDLVLEAQGEPFPHSSIIAQWFVFRAARERNVKVMLDGQGADELLAGYTTMLGSALADRLRRQGLGAWVGEIQALAADGSGERPLELAKATFRALVPLQPRLALARLTRRWPPQDLIAPDVLPQLPSVGDLSTLSRNMLRRTSLPGLLRYEDRNSMAHGVESRLPFLARDVVDLALSLPSELKVRNGWRKQVLREAVVDRVPSEILNRRRKLGFATPHDAWSSGPLGRWMEDVLRDVAGAPGSAILGPGRAALLAQQIGTSGRANLEAFRVAVFLRWCARFGISA